MTFLALLLLYQNKSISSRKIHTLAVHLASMTYVIWSISESLHASGSFHIHPVKPTVPPTARLRRPKTAPRLAAAATQRARFVLLHTITILVIVAAMNTRYFLHKIFHSFLLVALRNRMQASRTCVPILRLRKIIFQFVKIHWEHPVHLPTLKNVTMTKILRRQETTMLRRGQNTS